MKSFYRDQKVYITNNTFYKSNRLYYTLFKIFLNWKKVNSDAFKQAKKKKACKITKNCKVYIQTPSCSLSLKTTAQVSRARQQLSSLQSCSLDWGRSRRFWLDACACRRRDNSPRCSHLRPSPRSTSGRLFPRLPGREFAWNLVEFNM